MDASQLRPGRRRTSIADQRSDERHPVEVTAATLRPLGASELAAKLADISTFGCRLLCDETPADGSRLWLRLAGSMPVAATVMWSSDGVLGCRFDQPIDPRLMRTLIRPVH